MERNIRRSLVGIVVSTKMTKTIVIQVNTEKKDSLYGKKTVVSKKYKVHDENNIANVGDKVEVMECRPLSKDKHFRLVKVLEKAGLVA